MFIYYFLFNKTISLFYSLFVFRFSDKIIGLSSLNLAGSGLNCLWPAGMGLKLAGRAGPGLDQTFTVWVGPGPGLGLNSSLLAWAGPGFKMLCRPGPGLDSNC